MNESFPKRKPLRLPDYDYAQCNTYFLTVCTQNRTPIFWSAQKGGTVEDRLSEIGKLIQAELEKWPSIYQTVHLEKYCIMPDHVHLLLSIESVSDGRAQLAPTVSRLIQQFKGSISKQIGYSIWQKSFYDHVIRNEVDYAAIWQYIDNNPLKYEVIPCL